jgi:AraC family transcriptional regulator, regulatory protein of adaptative response / methylated-DNA-[protein]-cysteine methyltransferase
MQTFKTIHHNLSFSEMYQAMLRKDASYEGLFITAVKTTGIFCRPVCTARKPKPENVVFYTSTEEAILRGFRPCQVCRPLEKENDTPQYIKQLLNELNHDPFLRLKDHDLRQRGIEPHQLRRWFKKHHHLSFHAYQRMLRINAAYQKISAGGNITETAFEVGYESLSGFHDRFKSVFGEAPSHSHDKSVINMVRFTTPLGPMFGCATASGVCLVEFTNRKMLETEFLELRKRLNSVILPGSNPHLEKLQQELEEYFEGRRKNFTVPLVTPGTDFQQQVWKRLLDIPYGETRSYKQQAMALNNAMAIRAVARANGHNRISILIPCHRVIGESGNLTGYGGGLARKQWLLDLEKNNR